MSVYYVKEQGAYIRKLDQQLLIEKGGKTLADIPLVDISNLSIIGNVQVSTQALQMLMNEGIDVSFFSYSGKLLGQVVGDNTKNIFLRMNQYDLYMDLEKRLSVARIIVKNKIENQISVIRNFNWKNIEYDYHESVEQLRQMTELLPNAETSNEIMGLEGKSSVVYFEVFGHMFKGNIRFDGRNRRPPRDPINIILSLGYTLLTKEVSSALNSESFETYLGFLHGIRYGRQSLALDMVEEFRQPAIDRLTTYLFNKSIISEFDFETVDDRINLTEEGFKKFCNEYEKWMTSPVDSRDVRSFRNIIHGQVASLKKSIKEKSDYIPYAWKKEVPDVSGEL